MDNRKTYIGGSDVAAVLGLSPYTTPRQLWELKRGLRESQDAPILRAGHHMEAFVFDELERCGQKAVRANGATIRHSRYEWAGATIDGWVYVDGVPCIVDAKMSRRAIDRFDPSTIPDEWSLQLHHYAWIHGIDRAFLAVCNTAGGFEVSLYECPIDLDWYEDAVVPALADFWDRVQSGTPPEVPVYVEREPLPDVPEAADAVARYLDACDAEKAAIDAKEAARSVIMAAVDAAGRPKKCKAGGATVTVVQSAGRETIDAKALRADLPDVAAQYTRVGEPSTSIRITKGKAK